MEAEGLFFPGCKDSAEGDCSGPPEWTPYVRVYSLMELLPVGLVIGTPICSAHRESLRVEDLVTGELWQRVQEREFATTRRILSRDLCDLGFVPYGEAPHEFMACDEYEG